MRSVSSLQIDFSGVQSVRLVAMYILTTSNALCIVTTDFQWRAVSVRLVAMCIVTSSHAQCIVTTDCFQWRAVPVRHRKYFVSVGS
jgi:hypothetical protein